MNWEVTAKILAKLAPYYEKWKRRGGGAYIIEQNALRYIQLRKEVDPNWKDKECDS